MTTAHRFSRVFKPGLGLILAGLFVVHLAYADSTDPTVTPTMLDPAASQTTDPAVAVNATSPALTSAIVVLPLAAAEYDPFANKEQPVVVDPALIPPPAE